MLYVMPVTTFRRKPGPRDDEDHVAARYTPGQPLDDLAQVASKADSYLQDAELAEVTLQSGPVLLVRYLWIQDDHPARPDYVVVESGQWLAYSPGSDLLYTTDDDNWRHFYDQVP
jgi:hypothetical protein